VILFYENLAVYDKMWENVKQPDRLQLTVCKLRLRKRWNFDAG